MRTSAWHNGSGTYGISVGKANRDRYFDRGWETIEVEIEGEAHKLPISDGFWRNCPEIRAPVIRDWLRHHHTLDWPKHHPPRFELIPLGGNRFRLAD